MLPFEYQAVAADGARSSGVLRAAGPREAAEMLTSRGLPPVDVRPQSTSGSWWPAGKRRVAGRVMVRVYRQLADLLRSGVPLLRSLDLLAAQSSDGDLPEALSRIRKRVADGEGLAECLRSYPHLFDDLACSMVKAGQEGGFLEDVLARIADYTEREVELRGKVAGAMAYPVFLAVVGTIVIVVLVVFFVPQFAQMFERLRARGQLPALTIGLLATSDFLRSHGLVLLGALLTVLAVLRHYRQTPRGREFVDRAKLSIPKVGDVFRSLAIVRFSRVLGTLLANGIPILSALRIAKDSCGNVVLSEAVARAADNVTTGESLTEPLRASGYFPKDVIEMVAIAEESNTLEKVLLDISESTEKRTTRQLDLLVRLLEPLMLLVMAGITLVVVAALLLPVMKMSAALK